MNDVINSNNLVFVDSLELGDGYDWATIEVYYSSEKNRFFWLSGSGCSCTWLWEDVSSLACLCDGSRGDAARAMRQFAEAYRYKEPAALATAAKGVLEFRK